MFACKSFILLVFNRECMERNVMTSFRIFFTLFSNRTIGFFTLQCELFTSRHLSNNVSLVSARTGGVEGGGMFNQMWTDLDRGRGSRKFQNLCGHPLWMTPIWKKRKNQASSQKQMLQSFELQRICWIQNLIYFLPPF